jgi:hypothetical protein
MKPPDTNLDALYQELAGRFGALSQLFGKLNSPKAVQQLLDGLTSNDGAGFQPFVDQLNLPMLGKCYWLQEVIERVVSTPAGLIPGDCWLRDNLTQQERWEYLQIALRYRIRRPVDSTAVVTLKNGHYVIPPGPFLDELKAAGLVTCGPPQMSYETTVTIALSKPELVCV